MLQVAPLVPKSILKAFCDVPPPCVVIVDKREGKEQLCSNTTSTLRLSSPRAERRQL